MPVSPTRRRQAKFASYLGLLLSKFTADKMPVVVLELYRSLDTQRAYVARKASKTLDSYHLKGLAADIAFLDDIEDDGTINWTEERYRPYGEYWESLSQYCVWGGRFGDDPTTEKAEGWDLGHFEYRG